MDGIKPKIAESFWTSDDILQQKFDNIYIETHRHEKIGRFADWINFPDKKQSKPYYQNQYNQLDDEEDFISINSSRGLRPLNRNKIKLNFQKNRQTRDFKRPNQQVRQQNHKKKNVNQYRGRYDRHGSNYWYRKSSVLVRDTWKFLEDIDFSTMSKLILPYIPTVKDVYTAGAVLAYDKSFDYVRPEKSKVLKQSNYVFHKVPTCDDPIIRANIDKAKVFASDTLLSTLMACTRSLAPWDIVVHRVSNLLFFDKRPESDIELLTVNETSSDPKFDNLINSPAALSLEATLVNQYYSQQCVIPGTAKKMKNKNPFFKDEKTEAVPSVAYKYRLFDLGDGIEVLVRCEFDSYSQKDGCGINIKSLLEFGSKPSMSNWREEFETLSGSILATEIKNNSNKFAKWTASAIMAGDNLMKIGFISRDHYASNKKHCIIGSVNIESKVLVSQIGLNMNNCWGIIFALSKKLLSMPEGKYVILKDPLKPGIKLYSVPESAVNSNNESEDEGTEDHINNDEQNIDFGLDEIY